MSLREDPSPVPIGFYVSLPSAMSLQKRNFIPSPIYLVSKLPWLDMSKLIDELLVFD